MKLSIFLFFIPLLALAAPEKQVRMRIVTKAANIGFTVGADWKVIAMQSKLPKAVAAFQIANSADAGTPDSTNLAISLFEASSEDAKATLDKLLTGRAQGEIDRKKHGAWDVFSYSGRQEKTTYCLKDAVMPLADCVVMVRLAWPRLAKNPKAYDATMEKTFMDVIDSIANDQAEPNPAVEPTAPAKEPERIKSDNGQTIIKEFYGDGTIKSVTRLNPDGSLLGILHHTSKGTPTHFDYYDDQKRIRRTLYYRPDGTPKIAKEFDEQGKVVSEEQLDAKGYPVESTKPK